MRLLLRIVAVVAALLAALAGVLYLLLQPPAPLPLPSQGLVLEDVTLVEPGRSRAEHRRVVVRGGSLAEVEAARSGASDRFAGATVLPGLNDLHVHFPPAAIPGQSELFAFLFLYHGVTGVRSAGDVDGTATAPAREGLAAGHFPGPRLVGCGPFLDGDPPLWDNSIVVTTADEGRAAVARVDREGSDCVKAYNGLDAPSLAAVREEAAARGLPVIGHVPRGVSFSEARLDDAQHMIGVPPPWRGETPPYPFVLERWLDLDDARFEAIVATSLANDIAHTPTLVTTERLIEAEDYDALKRLPEAQLLPRFYREVIWNPVGGANAAAGLDADDFAMLRRAFERMQRTAVRLVRAGVRVHTGTDTLVSFVVPGAALHRELRLFVTAGLTPEEALALSTRASAEIFGVPGLGALEPGAPAELLIFRDDPTRDLAALGSLLGVVRDGRLYTRESLDAQLERYRAHFEGALFDAVFTPIVRRVLATTVGD